MDLAHALKVALETGTVRLGLAETLDAAQSKKAKLLIVAKTCPNPTLTKERAIGKIPIYHYDGSAVELGQACGRPFPVSAMAVLDPGSSAILTLET
ncbi:MAG TPA: 50S ribosomal protein L30e [Thermoplasmata archaeon]|nr:50S ribosomal protein L30e [Thermoplasmata archaeon]HYB78587.1 50S ribosomal protein L30e [Thermoplasmata archaeon]